MEIEISLPDTRSHGNFSILLPEDPF